MSEVGCESVTEYSIMRLILGGGPCHLPEFKDCFEKLHSRIWHETMVRNQCPLLQETAARRGRNNNSAQIESTIE
jgi:hypothetical protein